MNIKLSIVLPVYNERENLAILIPHIEETFKGHPFELIIVDDNSQDTTQELIRDLNRQFFNIISIKRESMFGIGSAIRDGYNRASGDFVLSSDADLSFSADDMLALYTKAQEGYDMVLGYKCPAKVDAKSLVSALGNMLIRTLSGMQFKNFSTNCRIIRTDQWKRIKTTENFHAFLFESVLKASRTGLRIYEIPVHFYDRKYGKSKLSFLREGTRFLLKSIKYSFIEK